ncbi:MAG: cellulase family glycosylhydrolase [Bacteroidota bacterium]
MARFYSLFFLLCSSLILRAQTVPFAKGVNLTGWFQKGSAQEIQFGQYSRQDFVNIQSLGCDVVRLPINLHAMTNGAPDYQLDPLFLNFLDQVVDWAEDLQIHLILDNHTFDPAADTDPAIEIPLVKVWKQMAAHYENRSSLLYYEVLNEPHGIDDQVWGQIQQNVIDSIRTFDQTHTIVVGPANWNSFYNLDAMPVYSDPNLIYTFHFYDPFIFTHQGATWVSPSMAPLANVPFPHHPDSMPSFPASLVGSWIENVFNDYGNSGTVSEVQNLIDIAVNFQQTRNVPVYCGEFGVYQPNSQENHRVFWYEQVKTYLESQNIPWTIWDYKGGFGLFEEGSNELFEHDLNLPLLNALGFNSPPQTPFTINPDSLGLYIYTDFTGPNITDAHSGGTVNSYSEENPNYGQYCLRWDAPNIYQSLAYDFTPNRDFSVLVDSAYALDLFIRGNQPGTQLDIRFLDTKTSDPNDHPWRIRYVIDETEVNWDSRWHHLHLPLSQFIEHGSWDNNQWYNPQGLFDWTAIDRLEIVAEYADISGTVWIDQLHITNQDSAIINDSTATSLERISLLDRWRLYPNPGQDQLVVETEWVKPSELRIYDVLGRLQFSARFAERQTLSVADLPKGMYLVEVCRSDGTHSTKRWLKK